MIEFNGTVLPSSAGKGKNVEALIITGKLRADCGPI